jgi:hypothetical protein
MKILSPEEIELFEALIDQELPWAIFREEAKKLGVDVIPTGGLATREVRSDHSRFFCMTRHDRVVGGRFN